MRRRGGLVVVALLLSACASSGPPAASEQVSPAPSASSPAGRALSFTTADGVRLTGRLYGSGSTAVVLSNMGDNDPALWDAFAPRLADRGYLVMTYSYRYPPHVQSFTGDMARHAVDDLRAAIAHLRTVGVTRLALAGGSLGGMVTAKVAASANAAAMVVIAAPADLDDYGLHVSAAELAGPMPKLFLSADEDTVVPVRATQGMFDRAAQPKELKTYGGSEHALHLFEGAHAADVEKTLVAFLTAKVPAAR
jgi:dienelactone hydrolase